MPDTAAHTTPEEAALWVGLSLIPGLGGQGFRELLHRFGTPEQIYATSHADLRNAVPEKIASRIKEGPDPALIADTLAWLEGAHNHLVTLADAD